MNFSSLSQNDKYDLLAKVMKNSQEYFNNGSKENYDFLTADGKINLLSVRGFKNGSSCTSTNTSFDDTLFVVYRKWTSPEKVDTKSCTFCCLIACR